jgi:hypothetical protein
MTRKHLSQADKQLLAKAKAELVTPERAFRTGHKDDLRGEVLMPATADTAGDLRGPSPRAQMSPAWRLRQLGVRDHCQPPHHYCPTCRPAWMGSSHPSSNDRHWQKISVCYKRAYPICEWPGCGRPVHTVDHIIPLAECGDRYSWLKPGVNRGSAQLPAATPRV